jgi:hypothetical protein
MDLDQLHTNLDVLLATFTATRDDLDIAVGPILQRDNSLHLRIRSNPNARAYDLRILATGEIWREYSPTERERVHRHCRNCDDMPDGKFCLSHTCIDCGAYSDNVASHVCTS